VFRAEFQFQSDSALPGNSVSRTADFVSVKLRNTVFVYCDN
jgi:hypothetical protein